MGLWGSCFPIALAPARQRMPITTATLLSWLRHAAALIHEQREFLTELDAAIGDADHGHNLDQIGRAHV